MDHEKKLANALSTIAASDDLRSIGKEITEAMIDAATDSEVLKAVPALSTILGVARVATEVRNSFFRRKLLLFIQGISHADSSQRQSFFEDHCATPQRRERLSRLVLHVLDDLRDEHRASIISALFLALVNQKISEDQFSALSDVAQKLTQSHLDLLKALSPDSPRLVADFDIAFLALHGLAVIDFTPHMDGYGLRYRLGVLGTAMLAAAGEISWSQ